MSLSFPVLIFGDSCILPVLLPPLLPYQFHQEFLNFLIAAINLMYPRTQSLVNFSLCTHSMVHSLEIIYYMSGIQTHLLHSRFTHPSADSVSSLGYPTEISGCTYAKQTSDLANLLHPSWLMATG